MPTSKRINFCGDSFCSSMHDSSWTTLLTQSLGAKIINLGVEGACHEIAIENFDPSADYTVCVWTHHNRLFNRRRLPINYAKARKGVYEKQGRTYQAALAYYEWLHDDGYAKKRQTRDLYWFDNEILSKYSKPLIHLWSFEKNYTFKNGIEFTTPLQLMYKYMDIAEGNTLHLNHMTDVDNESLFRLIKAAIDNHLTVA